MVRLSIEEISDTIGLIKKDEKTYVLGNTIIEIEKGGLKITRIGGVEINGAEFAMFTKIPFRYTINDDNYSFTNENNELIIYREDDKLEQN